jgi:Uncharacterized enzyme involved in biosynthesis of extracellular polysaccharides
MITRNWTGVVKAERADDYIAHLKNETFKKLTAIKGFITASTQKREVTDGVEFLVVSVWENMEAVQEFAGANADIAVVPPKAQEMMVRYDPVVRHYKEVFSYDPAVV